MRSHPSWWAVDASLGSSGLQHPTLARWSSQCEAARRQPLSEVAGAMPWCSCGVHPPPHPATSSPAARNCPAYTCTSKRLACACVQPVRCLPGLTWCSSGGPPERGGRPAALGCSLARGGRGALVVQQRCGARPADVPHPHLPAPIPCAAAAMGCVWVHGETQAHRVHGCRARGRPLGAGVPMLVQGGQPSARRRRPPVGQECELSTHCASGCGGAV
jgi:hypothetical protein